MSFYDDTTMHPATPPLPLPPAASVDRTQSMMDETAASDVAAGALPAPSSVAASTTSTTITATPPLLPFASLEVTPDPLSAIEVDSDSLASDSDEALASPDAAAPPAARKPTRKPTRKPPKLKLTKKLTKTTAAPSSPSSTSSSSSSPSPIGNRFVERFPVRARQTVSRLDPSPAEKEASKNNSKKQKKASKQQGGAARGKSFKKQSKPASAGDSDRVVVQIFGQDGQPLACDPFAAMVDDSLEQSASIDLMNDDIEYPKLPGETDDGEAELIFAAAPRGSTAATTAEEDTRTQGQKDDYAYAMALLKAIQFKRRHKKVKVGGSKVRRKK